MQHQHRTLASLGRLPIHSRRNKKKGYGPPVWTHAAAPVLISFPILQGQSPCSAVQCSAGSSHGSQAARGRMRWGWGGLQVWFGR